MEVKSDPVSLEEAKRISKSAAQRALRTAFLEARFQTIQNPEGTPEGFETWQVWCKGNYGRMTAIVEVTGLPVALPLACMRSAFQRIGQQVIVNTKTVTIKPIPPPAPPTQVASPAGLALPVDTGAPGGT